MMGITMKKTALSVAALLALGIGSASAADLGKKLYTKAPPVVAAVPAWDLAFGGGLASDYIFRGITQSNHKPSVSAYFEPRFNINPNFQVYAGVAGSSIAFPNRAAAEIDLYGGVRPTFGPVSLDLGGIYYWYPGGQCFNAVICPTGPGNLPINGNVAKADASYFEVYGKGTWAVTDIVSVGGNVYYTRNFLNTGANGTYASATAKITAPAGMLPNDLGAYVSGEYGRQWLGTTDAFYALTQLPDYNTWNIGIGFTWKVVTLDLRYYDTSLNKGDCNAITGDHTAFAGVGTQFVTAANPGGFGSNWCDARFVGKLSFDISAMQNLK